MSSPQDGGLPTSQDLAKLQEDTKRRLRAAKEIPTLPTVMSSLMETINNPKSTARDLAKVIEMDQALATRLLKMVNSSFYGLSRTVADIDRAIVFLGFGTVKQLAMGVSVMNFLKAKESGGFDPTAFWTHGLRCGVAARALAKRAKVAEDPFVLGILHDLGQLITYNYMRDLFDRILKLHRDQKLAWRQAEIQVLGLDHQEVGFLLCERWKFPMSIAHAIRHHHHARPPVPPDVRPQVELVYLGNQVARAIEEQDGLRPREEIGRAHV